MWQECVRVTKSVYFDVMLRPVACSAGGHRKIYKQGISKLDIKFRKIVRTIVGLPGDLGCSPPCFPKDAKVTTATQQNVSLVRCRGNCTYGIGELQVRFQSFEAFPNFQNSILARQKPYLFNTGSQKKGSGLTSARFFTSTAVNVKLLGMFVTLTTLWSLVSYGPSREKRQ